MPASDAFNPEYMFQSTVGQGSEKFDNSTATFLFEVSACVRAVAVAVAVCSVCGAGVRHPGFAEMSSSLIAWTSLLFAVAYV